MDNGTSFRAGYVCVAGIASVGQRDETWVGVKAANAGIEEVVVFDPISNSVVNQARFVLQAHPEITVMFAPYDEFTKSVKIAVGEAGIAA